MFKRKLEFYSVEEKLPEREGYVFTVNNADIYAVLNYSTKHEAFNAYNSSDNCQHKITDIKYWAYLPNAWEFNCSDNVENIKEN